MRLILGLLIISSIVLRPILGQDSGHLNLLVNIMNQVFDHSECQMKMIFCMDRKNDSFLNGIE